MDEAFSVMTQSAVALHEVYVSLREAGFNQDEALDYMAKLAKQKGCRCGGQSE